MNHLNLKIYTLIILSHYNRQIKHLHNSMEHTVKLDSDDYHYLSIESALKRLFSRNDIEDTLTDLNIKIGIDGLPLFRSSKLSLWPIMVIVSPCIAMKTSQI